MILSRSFHNVLKNSSDNAFDIGSLFHDFVNFDDICWRRDAQLLGSDKSFGLELIERAQIVLLHSDGDRVLSTSSLKRASGRQNETDLVVVRKLAKVSISIAAFVAALILFTFEIRSVGVVAC